MKRILLAGIVAATLSIVSCKKTEDVNANNFYNNKILTLKIENEEIDAGDFVSMRVAAVRVGDKPLPNATLIVNGQEILHPYVDINTEMIEDGVVMIETKDSAWQFVVEYDFKANTSPYSLMITPTFNGKAQESKHFWVSTSTPHKGKLEIKEYQP